MVLVAPKRVDLKPAELVESTEKKKPKVKKKPAPQYALRFEVNLSELKSPEISWTKLCLEQEKKQRTLKTTNLNASGEEDLAALARQLEEKYGNAYNSKRASALTDLGDGYDSEDSFIDNEEAYDELVPSTLTTQHGGFYINNGTLAFKEVSDDEIVTTAEKPKRKRVKNKLESDDDSSPGQLKKKSRPGKMIATTKKLQLVGYRKNKLKQLNKPSALKMLKKKMSMSVSSSEDSAATTGELAKKSQQYDSLIDDVIRGGAPSSGKPGSQSESAKTKEKKETPSLPENLPEAAGPLIDILKKTALEVSETKTKYFTANVNDNLLKLDDAIRGLAPLQRTSVYGHLSSFLPINRETIMKRLKQLRQRNLSNELQAPIEKLKLAINAEMPSQLEKHNAEVQARLQSKLEDVEKRDDTADGDEDDESPIAPPGEESATGTAEKKNRFISRKKFAWTDPVRNCLNDVVRVKMEGHAVTKVKGQSAEDYLKEFLENEVRGLWPKGWMQMRVLYKESRSAHLRWTSNAPPPPPPKPTKKPQLITTAMKMAANIQSTTKKSTNQTQVKLTEPAASQSMTMSCGSTNINAGEKKANTKVEVTTSLTTLETLSQAAKVCAAKDTKASDPGNPFKNISSLLGNTITTGAGGEKLVMSGERIIGKLIPTDSSTVRVNSSGTSTITKSTESGSTLNKLSESGTTLVSSSKSSVIQASNAPSSIDLQDFQPDDASITLTPHHMPMSSSNSGPTLFDREAVDSMRRKQDPVQKRQSHLTAAQQKNEANKKALQSKVSLLTGMNTSTAQSALSQQRMAQQLMALSNQRQQQEALAKQQQLQQHQQILAKAKEREQLAKQKKQEELRRKQRQQELLSQQRQMEQAAKQKRQLEMANQQEQMAQQQAQLRQYQHDMMSAQMTAEHTRQQQQLLASTNQQRARLLANQQQLIMGQQMMTAATTQQQRQQRQQQQRTPEKLWQPHSQSAGSTPIVNPVTTSPHSRISPQSYANYLESTDSSPAVQGYSTHPTTSPSTAMNPQLLSSPVRRQFPAGYANAEYRRTIEARARQMENNMKKQ